MLSILEIHIVITIFYFFIFGIAFCNSTNNSFPRLDSLLLLLFGILCFNSIYICSNTSFLGLSLFNNLIYKDSSSNLLSFFIISSSLVSSASLYYYNKSLYIPLFEYLFLILLFIMNSVLLFSVNNLFLFFLLLEIQSISLFILSSINKRSRYSIESSLKYFVLGSFSSIILLLGISLIYISTSFMFFDELSFFSHKFSTNIYDGTLTTGMGMGLIFLSVGFLFKLYCAPFHFWASDIYQGSALSSVIIFASSSFFVFFYLFIKIFFVVFYSYSFLFSPFFFIFSVLSLVFGTIGGLLQKKIKRLMAYSSVTATGYILLILCSNNFFSLSSSFFFLFSYFLGVIGVFISISGIVINKNSFLNFSTDLTNFFNSNKLLSFFIACFFFSLGGIPPFFGFLGKLEILGSLVSSHSYYLFFFFFFISTLSFLYYGRIVKYIYSRNVSFFHFSTSYSYIVSLFLFFIFFFSVSLIHYNSFLYLLTNLISYSLLLT